MVKINAIGGIFGSSGYANHARQLFEALIALNPDTKVETNLMQGWEVLVSDALLHAIKKPRFTKEEGAITVYVGMPHTAPSVASIPHNGFYPYLVWEGNKVPKHFANLMLRVAKSVLVPSSHTAGALVTTDPHFDSYCDRISHGVDVSKFTPSEPNKGNFVFVANKGWAQGMNDRGGVQFLLIAFCQEFRSNEAVQLNLKINPAYCPPGWNVQQELNKLNLAPDHPHINISVDDIVYAKMPEIYKGAHCFVSPTMAESFSIPCLEAMACGLPVITTNYGGQTDFVNDTNGWLIDYDMVEVKSDWQYEGIHWALPRLDHLRKLMRYAYEHRDECAAKGKKAREDAMLLTWENSAKKLLEVVNRQY